MVRNLINYLPTDFSLDPVHLLASAYNCKTSSNLFSTRSCWSPFVAQRIGSPGAAPERAGQ